jgi:small-conductance mechanosensitive channel
VTNLSRPDETHLITLSVRIATTERPRVVEDVLRSVLETSTRIVRTPPPVVALKNIDAMSIEAELQFRVESLSIGMEAKNEIVELVYAQCRLNGLSLAVSPCRCQMTYP